MDPLRSDPSRKGSVVNVNPVNTRPPSDTPEIRKYKKRFNSEILCAALWGMCEIHLPEPSISESNCHSGNCVCVRVRAPTTHSRSKSAGGNRKRPDAAGP